MVDLEVKINIDKETIDPNEVSFWLIVSAIAMFLLWGTFVVFYFSRLSAIFLTFLIDKYLRLSKNGIYFRIGSVSITGLHAGKIMFRNVIYDNGDMTLKINDGHLLLKYWRPIENRRLNLEKKRASRLQLVLNGLNVNLYNNLQKYSEIARIRRFGWFFENNNMGEMRPSTKPPDSAPPSSVWENIWNLIGVVNIEVSSGCVLVGNKFLPYALWTHFENLTSKTNVGESKNDRALLSFEGETENFSISLIKNEQYEFGPKDKEPPRTVGKDGFPLLQTASLSIVYKQDLLGYVTDDEPQSITSKVPIWSSEWKFGDNTVFSYGPWAEQQRMLLYSFFYPADYQNATPTVMPQRGNKRILIKHDVKIILSKETCIDIWFMRGGQLESIRTRCGPESHMDMSILWITTEKGFYWNMNANFENFSATTSLLFTRLIESTRFKVNGSFEYPLTWNGEQTWKIEYTFTEAVAWFVWDHKRLFSDLINDWMGEEPSDITKFVPFRVYNKINVVDSFEVIMLLNECNWIDPADKNAENVEVAIVGQKLTFDCELPFTDFMPQVQKMFYSMRGEKHVAMRAKFPPDSATEPIRAALCRMARCHSNASPSPHGKYSKDKDTWFEMWRTELIEMNFDHQYKPIVLKDHIPSDIPFSALMDFLPEPATHPWALEPDFLAVDILIEGSDVKFTGLLVKVLFELKNNYFGWYDSMTSIENICDPNKAEDVNNIRSAFDKVPPNSPAELYRPMNVDVNIRVCNVRAEMLVYSPAIDPGEEPEKCPVICLEEVVVEIKKTKTQSLIQVGVGPVCAFLDESSSSGGAPGCITLNGFQFRGHAMYSSKDVAWDMGLVEYGWIMEILLGDINATLDISSHPLVLHQIIESLLIFIIQPDDASKIPERMQFCQHGQLIKSCSVSGKKKGVPRSCCRTEEELKYRQIRVSVDSINLAFVEDKTILQTIVDPLKVTVCNAHEGRFTEHVCIRAPGATIKQAVRIGERKDNKWVEGASIGIEGVSLDIELPNKADETVTLEAERMEFVKMHDVDSKRLQFLWADHSVWGCACFGNTAFFANSDAIGMIFMETGKKRKFFVPGIEKNPELQPMVLQSVLDRSKCMLTYQQHNYYRANVKKSTRNGKTSLADTESFHSAQSRQISGNRILQSNELLSNYVEFINTISVTVPIVDEPVMFGEPGAVAKWCQAHPATKFMSDYGSRGVNAVRLISKKQKNGNLFTVLEKKEPVEQDLTFQGATKCKRKLAINGVAATSLDIFLSPIGLEGIERIVTSLSHSISAINPCLVVHMCYRECVLRKHRQPLTENLFGEDHPQVPPEVEVTIDLPAINVGLFQCAIKQQSTSNLKTDEISLKNRTANMALILIDGAAIQTSRVIHPKPEKHDELTPEQPQSIPTTVYQMNFGLVTAQLLQLTDREAVDFGASSMVTTQNNWEQCAIAKRMPNFEPRVMLDFNICDVSIILERSPILMFTRLNTTSTPFQSPVPQNGRSISVLAPTPTVEATAVKRKQILIYQHSLKAAVGSITTSVVMARPQELTAGDEFPIYEALAPVMVSWLTVIDNFQRTLTSTIKQFECWQSVAMIKVLRLALDCTDPRVTVRIGKNRMTCTRVLDPHQGSCSSCLLLRTLFRWFAYAENAKEAVSHRLHIRTEFEVAETRKTALMALLSHWQSDIGKELKLVSLEDASQFKVTRPDEAAMVALTKMSKRLKKSKKNEGEKKETRIVIENASPLAKKAAATKSPLLQRLRRHKAGTDENEYDSILPLKKTLGDVELQEIDANILYDLILEEEEEEDESEDEQEASNKNENVDLYTWMRNAQRETALRRRKMAGGKESFDGSDNGIDGLLKEKEYINPMDIQQKAFYYSLYRWAKLQWTNLDNIESDHFHLDYSIVLMDVDVRMMAKSIKNSSDHQRKYITPAQQKVMQVRNAMVNGKMIWNLERDEKKKTPLNGQWTISYNGNIEGIRFLIGMAVVSLGKEMSLVLGAIVDANNELKTCSPATVTPKNMTKHWSLGQLEKNGEWDEKVLDMTRDFEKHMQRMRAAKNDSGENIRVFVNGSAMVSSVVLESVLNDLYVSAMILKIDLAHSKNPIPVNTGPLLQNVSVSTVDERKTATLSRKPTSVSALNSKVDDVSVALTKMTLTLSESDSMNKKSDILRCSLNASSLNFHTKVQGFGGILKNKSNSTIAAKNENAILGTWATLKLGALEGNMPMAAHSLHDVVMRHGKELEQQFNRLSAQPATTPLGNPMSSFSESVLTKVSEPLKSSSATPSPLLIPSATPTNISTLSTATIMPSTPTKTSFRNYQMTKRAPIAVINFLLEIASIEMNIQLLPSLHAKYRIHRASSNGITGDKAKWTIAIDDHFFEFFVSGQGGKKETFRLELPSIKCTGHYSVEPQHKPSTEKKLVYREGGSLQMTVYLGSVNHTFTTELLNQLMFAEHSFRTELASLINRIRSSSTSSSSVPSSMKSQATTQSEASYRRENSSANLKLVLPVGPKTPPPSVVHDEKPPLLFAIKVVTKETKTTSRAPSPASEKASAPWLQLTAATPTQTAVRLTIDSLEGELTNKWVVKEEGSKERIYGSAVIHFNAKLGQLVKVAQYEEVNAELTEYATFMTQVRVENKERNMFSSAYSYHISLNRPIFLVKAAAIDKAILLWLNYKNTYDFWRNEREKVVNEKTTQKKASTPTTAEAPAAMFSPTQITADADMNLSLAINNGMYMCMPLYSTDVTQGMPALVLSLQKSELNVLVKKELTCKASFNGFKLTFIEDFNENALTQSFLDATQSEQSNCFFFPEGTYQLCSKAIQAPKAPAKWILSVSAEMQGVEIDLDTKIGKLTKLLVNTCSMIGRDDGDDGSFLEYQNGLESVVADHVEGADEFKKLKDDERVPWLENKMHEHSRAVFELAARGISAKQLEVEKHKLRQFELIRFKAFRRNVVDKFRQSGSPGGARAATPSDANSRRNSMTMGRRSSLISNSEKSEHKPKNDDETVNFNLDVKLNITSGTCTFRTQQKEKRAPMNFREFEASKQIGETMKRLNQGTREMKAMFEPPSLTVTSFSIPSVEIKAYHVSDPAETTFEKFGKHLEKNEKLPTGLAKDAEKLNKDLNSKSRFGASNGNKKQNATESQKRGCFYMFVGLSSMPNETVVTPHLATYLELVLEPLPPSAVFHSKDAENSQIVSTIDPKMDTAGNNEINNIVAMDTSAFPIDFVLYLDVQSSTIRFDGKQQNSRTQAQADCLLTLPRLTLELSTKRSENAGDNYVGGIYISGQFKGFMLKIFNPLEPELDLSRALQLSLDLLSFVISRNKNSSAEADNRVRFVFSSQIGKASFEYNFRRLGELIQFPKPWYRAAIARRVFFGDQAAARPREDISDISGIPRSREHGHDNKNKIPAPASSTASSASSTAHTHQNKPWTALVLAAIQWNEFEVVAFMSNTMGKTTWNATKGLLWGDAKLNSSMERDVTVSFVLGSSELCAKDGAISGNIKLNKLKIYGAHSLYKDSKKPPVNKAKLKLDWVTANIEWMSRRVLIAKWSVPSFRIDDFYKGVKDGDVFALESLGMNVKASWSQLQMVITKSTVEDIEAIVTRLIAFIDEQLKNSRILLGNFGNTNATTAQKKASIVNPERRKPMTHFWEKVLDYVSEMQLNDQLMPLMEKEGAKVGGHVELKAGAISLVLMKGDMNSDTWAVFHLRDAYICFDPEAKMDFLDQKNKQKIGILLKQSFSLQLGSRKDNTIENLANVCRVQTRFNGSRHLQKTDEILEYFIGEVMKTLGLHHSIQKKQGEDEKTTSPLSAKESPATSTLKSVASFSRFRSPNSKENAQDSQQKKSNHSVLELFQFPGLKAQMTSEQLNGLDDGDYYESAFMLPMEVFTTFVCDFYSEVAIETDFNAQVSFLPELLKSYLKESTPTSQTSTSSASSPMVSRESDQPDMPKDQRIFTCKQWQVDPKLRFIDRIKWTPPVVDDILKKLQIFDHRNTIPKVIQRAVLDPLDVCLATAVTVNLEMIDNKHTIKKFEKSRYDSVKDEHKMFRGVTSIQSEENSIKIDVPNINTPSDRQK